MRKVFKRKLNDNMNICWVFILCVGATLVSQVSSTRRKSRQFNEEFVGCSFPRLQNTSARNAAVSGCNFSASVEEYGVYSWAVTSASKVQWTGGPQADASNLTDSGFAYVETASLLTDRANGKQAKAWLKSTLYPATDPHGLCFRFKYNIQGLSASKVRLLRVQALPSTSGSYFSSSLAVPYVNSILLPTLSPEQISSDQLLGVNVKLVAPWSPFQPILNQSGARETIDELWSSSDSTNGQWIAAHVTYSTPYPHVLIFEAIPLVSRAEYRGFIALDEIEFQPSPCPHECEFNVGFCEWSNSQEDDFDWSLGHGTRTRHTGPLRDQVSSSWQTDYGGYAYIDSRHPRNAGRKASLISGSISPVSTPEETALCFVFWIHMYGEGIGQLRVVKQTEEDEVQVWKVSHAVRREVWYKAQVTLASQVAFKIKLEATIGETGYGDIAVDSFRLEKGACPGLPEGSVNNGADCTFQDGPCGWVATNSHPGVAALWTRASLNYLAGLPQGHEQGSSVSSVENGYMLFDTHVSIQRAGSRGFLTSPVLAANNQTHCLSFWFYQASLVPQLPRIGSLEVVLFEPNVTNKTTRLTPMTQQVLWRMNSHHEERWTSAQVSFEALSGGYVSFVAMRGNGVRGIIAVDDISIHSGHCHTLPRYAEPSPIDCYFDSSLCSWTVGSIPLQPSPTANTTATTNTTTTTTTTEAATTTATPTTSSLDSTTAEARRYPPDATNPVSSSPATTTTTTTSSSIESTSYSLDGTTAEARSYPPDSTTAPSSTSTPTSTTTSSRISTPTSSTTTSRTSSTASEATSKLAAGLTTTEVSNSERATSSRTSDRQPLAGESSRSDDEVIPLGVKSLIEVVSVDKNGASKSIIISQPRRTVRSTKLSSSQWIGYNYDPSRSARIVTYRNNQRLSDAGAPTQPDGSSLKYNNAAVKAADSSRIHFPGEGSTSRGHVTAYSAGSLNPHLPPHVPGSLLRNTNNLPPTNRQESRPDGSTGLKQDPPTTQWTLAARGRSFYNLREHTFQFPEGGYVFFESFGKQTTTSLWSRDFSLKNGTHCLTFFFSLANNDDNSTLSVQRRVGGSATGEELWSLSAADVKRNADLRSTSTWWIPAQLPIEASNDKQLIVFQGSATNGGFALDDIRLSAEDTSCSVLPRFAAVLRRS